MTNNCRFPHPWELSGAESCPHQPLNSAGDNEGIIEDSVCCQVDNTENFLVLCPACQADPIIDTMLVDNKLPAGVYEYV